MLCYRQSHSINSPIASTITAADTTSPHELSTSAPDHITPYIAHLGSGNQVHVTNHTQSMLKIK